MSIYTALLFQQGYIQNTELALSRHPVEVHLLFRQTARRADAQLVELYAFLGLRHAAARASGQ